MDVILCFLYPSFCQPGKVIADGPQRSAPLEISLAAESCFAQGHTSSWDIPYPPSVDRGFKKPEPLAPPWDKFEGTYSLQSSPRSAGSLRTLQGGPASLFA